MSKTSQRELSEYQLGARRAKTWFKHIGVKLLSRKYNKYFRKGWNEAMIKRQSGKSGL